MRRYGWWRAGMLAALVALAGAPAAQAQSEQEFRRLERQVEQLTEQVNRMETEGGPAGGHGGATVGGYAELHLNKELGDPLVWDFHRFVLFFGKGINDWITFNSEVEIEHALVKDGQGEVELEQAYLDFALTPDFHARGGILLVPMGIINPVHEPNTFYGVERPAFHHDIIPTTWFDAGAGLTGNLAGRFHYELYAMAPLDASGFDGAEGVRGGRAKGYKTKGDPAFTGRLQYRAPGLATGVSFYTADANSGETVDALGDTADTNVGSVQTNLFAYDLEWQPGAFRLRAEYAMGTIDNSDELNQAIAAERGDNPGVGSQFNGYYVEPALRVWSRGEQSIGVFVRYEDINPQAEVEQGQVDDANNYTYTVAGANYWPHPDVALKADYTIKEDDAGEETLGYNLGLGWQF